MSDIKFICPGCSQHLEAPEELGGQTVECPECQTRMTIPADDEFSDKETQTPEPSTQQQDQEPTIEEESCENCGKPMEPNSVLCLSCGFHKILRKQVRTQFE